MEDVEVALLLVLVLAGLVPLYFLGKSVAAAFQTRPQPSAGARPSSVAGEGVVNSAGEGKQTTRRRKKGQVAILEQDHELRTPTGEDGHGAAEAAVDEAAATELERQRRLEEMRRRNSDRIARAQAELSQKAHAVEDARREKQRKETEEAYQAFQELHKKPFRHPELANPVGFGERAPPISSGAELQPGASSSAAPQGGWEYDEKNGTAAASAAAAEGAVTSGEDLDALRATQDAEYEASLSRDRRIREERERKREAWAMDRQIRDSIRALLPSLVDEDDDAVRRFVVLLRLPNGERRTRTFDADSSSVQDVVNFARCEYSPDTETMLAALARENLNSDGAVPGVLDDPIEPTVLSQFPTRIWWSGNPGEVPAPDTLGQALVKAFPHDLRGLTLFCEHPRPLSDRSNGDSEDEQ